MGTRTSRTAFPITGARQGAAIGTWGIWLTMASLGTALAGLVVSGLYLYWGQDAWPPSGFEEPPMLRGALALGLAGGAAAAVGVALRVLRAGRERTSGHVLLVAVLLSAGSLATLVADLALAPWGWDEHVYTSLYWVFVGYAATFVAVSTIMTGAVLIQRAANVLDAGRHLELEVTAVFWILTLATVASCFGMVHLLPYR